MIDVFIIEDQRLMREGMEALINATEDLQVIKATSCQPSVVEDIQETKPDGYG